MSKKLSRATALALIAGALGIVVGVIYLKRSDAPVEAQTGSPSVEANPWADERFSRGAASGTEQAASKPVIPSLVAGPATRAAKVTQMLASTNPAERMQAVKLLYMCVEMQRNAAQPGDLPMDLRLQLSGEIQKHCSDIPADLLAKRFAAVERLAAEGHPGAAVLNISMAPDGTDGDAARKDPSYSAWYRNALGHLESSAKAGELESIRTARGHVRLQEGRTHDFFVYRVAELEGSKALLPTPQDAAQIAGMIEVETKLVSKTLTPEQIAKAKVEGLALAKLVLQRKGN